MYVVYFDEAKPAPEVGLNSFFIGGIAISEHNIKEIEEKTIVLAEKYFGTRESIENTEFHCTDIQRRKKHFRKFNEDQCLEILIELTKIISDRDKIKHIYARIDEEKIRHDIDCGETAFMYFLERVNGAIPIGEKFLLIGDQDDTITQKLVIKCDKYRRSGTYYIYGKNINKMVDTVHFARSHHSRLIQLADVYVYYLRTNKKEKKCGFSKKYIDSTKELNLFPTSYKHWPL